MVFLPDDAGFDQKSGEGSSSGSYSSGDESGVNANQVVRQYSPITGYDLESREELNERLRPTGLERHRLQIAPDEAFGAIFRMEGSLVDTMPIHVSAWTRVAEEMNLTKPELADVSLAMTMPPEKAMTDGVMSAATPQPQILKIWRESSIMISVTVPVLAEKAPMNSE